MAPSFLLRPPRTRGFTLVELLVAVAVFALLVSAMYGGLNSLLGNADSLTRSASVYEAARVCLDRMAQDLQSVYVTLPPAYVIPDFNADADPYRFTGNGTGPDVRLRFVAFSHVPLDRGLMAEAGRIVYYLHAPRGSESPVLMRSDTVLRYDAKMEEGADPVVCENVASLELTFYD
ncbi:MAG: PulJ/GspJ family protein, partial [Thermodesulfobacteriota bacterium]